MIWRKNDAGRFLLALAAALSVVVHPQTAAAGLKTPEWVMETPQDARYLYGVGVSSVAESKEGRAEAVAMGINSIATAIFSAVSGSYEQVTTEIRTTVNDRVSLRTAHTLEGVEVVSVKRADALTYALVRYPRADIPAARLRHASDRRAAESRAETLMGAAGGAADRIRSLIRAANLLSPYGGYRYDEARASLFMTISDLRVEASRAGQVLLVTPADLPMRLGEKRFAGRLDLTDADRLRNVAIVDTVAFCVMIADRDLARQVSDALSRREARFQGDCVSVSGRLSGVLASILPSLGICVANYSAMTLTADYTSWRDEAYSLPLTTIQYTVKLSDASAVKNAETGSATVIGDESAGIRLITRHIRAAIAAWFKA